MIYFDLGCIHMLNTRKYCDNTRKYCVNTQEYWANTWKMCLPASAILESFEAMLMYFKACGRSLLWNWLLKLILTENLFKIASKRTSIVTILANIAQPGDHIFQVYAQYLQVLSQCLRVLSGWMHPNLGQLPLGCFEPIYSWVWPKPIPSFGYNSDNRHF